MDRQMKLSVSGIDKLKKILDVPFMKRSTAFLHIRSLFLHPWYAKAELRPSSRAGMRP